MSVISGIYGAESSEDAAEAQASASKRAAIYQHEQFLLGREDSAPWLEAGQWALGQSPGFYIEGNYAGATRDTLDQDFLRKAVEREVFGYELPRGAAMLPDWKIKLNNAMERIRNELEPVGHGTGLTGMIAEGPGEFVPEEDPGYRFGFENFIRDPYLAQASATGRLGTATEDNLMGLPGGAMQEITRYASDYATTKYDNFLDRWYQSLTPYQSLAGVGQTTAAQGAQNAITSGQGVAQSIQNAGDARASGYINQANAVSGAMNNAVNGISMARYLGWGSGGGAATASAGTNTAGQLTQMDNAVSSAWDELMMLI